MREAIWTLWITPKLAFEQFCPRPNAWRRFWLWALLGWKCKPGSIQHMSPEV